MITNSIWVEREEDDQGAFLSSDSGQESYLGLCRGHDDVVGTPSAAPALHTDLRSHHCLNSYSRAEAAVRYCLQNGVEESSDFECN